MRKMCFAVLMLAGLVVSASAAAETVRIPCEEFVNTTGKRISCDKMPFIKLSAERWAAETAAAEARNAPDADVPPWDRQETKQAQPAGKTIGEVEPCSVPPWKRPEGAKCD